MLQTNTVPSSGFKASGLRLRLLNHFELIFVKGKRYDSSFFLFRVITSFVKKTFFPMHAFGTLNKD